MSYEWLSNFEDGETRAVCSKCGAPYRYPSEIVRQNDGLFYCKRRCLEQTVLTRDRIQAQSRKRREAPPPKFVQAPSYAEDFFDAEDAVMSTVVRDLPHSTDAAEIAWGVRYLCDVVTENRRPEGWILRAKSVIAERCNYLLTRQYGAPTGPSPSTTSTSVRYGGFADGTTLYTSIAIAAGAALVKAYNIFGTQTYLDAASRCATFLRHMQCQDLDANGQTSTYGGALYHIGGFAEGVNTSGAVAWVNRYNVFDVAAVWFLDLLGTLQGGNKQYGEVSSADFTAPTTATLDDMIDECVAFAVSGAKDAAYSGVLKAGLSTDYPRSYYSNQGPASAGLGTWLLQISSDNSASVLRGEEVALALFGLNAAGEAVDLVTAVFDWLMTFTANPLNAAPVEDPQLLIGTLVGTYDPTLALATELEVDTGTLQDHAGSGYSWLAGGLLAPIASVRLPTRFLAAKTQIGIPTPSKRGPAPQYREIGETGYSGFAFQWSEALP